MSDEETGGLDDLVTAVAERRQAQRAGLAWRPPLWRRTLAVAMFFATAAYGVGAGAVLAITALSALGGAAALEYRFDNGSFFIRGWAFGLVVAGVLILLARIQNRLRRRLLRSPVSKTSDTFSDKE